MKKVKLLILILIIHLDKNKLNNNIENVEWIIQKDNIIHDYGRKRYTNNIWF